MQLYQRVIQEVITVSTASERVPLSEAAKLLGMSKQGVREHMKRDLFPVPIGYVTKQKERYQYHIYRTMLNRHLGKEDAPEEEQC